MHAAERILNEKVDAIGQPLGEGRSLSPLA
jgi:hypothetical protein